MLYPFAPSEHRPFVLGKGKRMKFMARNHMRADRNKYLRVQRALPFPGGEKGCRWRRADTPSGRRMFIAF